LEFRRVLFRSCASQVGLTGQITRVTYANYTETTAPNLRIQISQQPVNRYVLPGGTATFNVVAEAFAGATSLGSGELTYQWQRNGVNISSANSAGYTTPPA